MANWTTTLLGDVLPFHYGKNLPADSRTHSGEFSVVSSAGVIDSHNEALVDEPSIVIGRKGSVGRLTFCPDPVWPTDTAFYAVGSQHIDIRFAFYLLHTLPLSEMNNDSAVPGLNRNDAAAVPIRIPEPNYQRRVAAVLGALDDKITANRAVIGKTLALQDALFEKVLPTTGLISLREVCEPILGGTPKRSDDEAWVGSNRWASVADMTSAKNSHLVSTAEHISDDSIRTRRFAPLPAGGVLLSARGTVGHVVSVVFPTSFNQSAYGFIAPEGFETALRLVIRGAVAELKSKSYGSVFSTITKDQINECQVPDIFNDSYAELNENLAALEKRIIAAELENETLARTRDELLPLLMSGRITVAGASESGVGNGVEGMLEGMS